MRKFLSWCCFAVVLMLGKALYAQSAQEVIEISYKNYSEMTSYAGVIANRQAYISIFPAAEGEEPRFNVSSVRFTQLDAKWRRPGDWLILKTQNYGSDNDSPGRVQFSALSRLGSGPVLQNTYSTPKSVAQSIPSDYAPGVVKSFISREADQFVLKQFAAGSDDSGNIFWGVTEAEFKEDEICQGDLCYQIKGRTTGRHTVYLWISKSRFLLMRSLTISSSIQRPNMMGQIPGPRNTRPEEPLERSRQRLVVDTLLMDQQINPALSSNVFSIPSSGKFDPAIGDRPGFSDFASVVKLIPAVNSENGSGSGSGFNTGGSGGNANVVPTPTPTRSASDAASSSQMLTASQMDGIVLIDGDESTGSGFMTKIKGVDFVVTNLHVVSGNKKFTLKTLRGVEVPVLGIFGAVGSDIAILRIGKGEGDLTLAPDVVSSAKIGDRVVVVGNRLGGGVATQTSGNVVGIGPTRVEVSANFESGNSGSPIFDLNTNEVIGIATYAETRRVQIEDATESSSGSGRTMRPASTVEKRWFGYRVDAVTKWEPIDLTKLNAQAERIAKFRGLSEALVAFLRLDFRTARQHPRLTGLLENFETRYRATAGNNVTAASEVKDLFRVVRTISEDGMRELSTGDYYDYYRTCLYWENSITSQLEYRKLIVEALKKYEANYSSYVSRMRNGG